MLGSMAILHKTSSEPRGKVEAFLHMHPAPGGWAGKAGAHMPAQRACANSTWRAPLSPVSVLHPCGCKLPALKHGAGRP